MSRAYDDEFRRRAESQAPEPPLGSASRIGVVLAIVGVLLVGATGGGWVGLFGVGLFVLGVLIGNLD